MSKLFGDNTSSSPSILYDTNPLSSVFIYSCPLLSSSSYFLLFSIRLLIYEPEGLFSPAIFAFLISVSEILFLYSFISSTLLVKSSLSRLSSICRSKICISAEYASVCPSKASCISLSSSAIFFFSCSSL